MMYVISYLIIGCIVTMFVVHVSKKRGNYDHLVVNSAPGEKILLITVILLWLPYMLVVYSVMFIKFLRGFKP